MKPSLPIEEKRVVVPMRILPQTKEALEGVKAKNLARAVDIVVARARKKNLLNPEIPQRRA